MFATLRPMIRRCAAVAAVLTLVVVPALPAAARPEMPLRAGRALLATFDEFLSTLWTVLAPAPETEEPRLPAEKNGPEADPYGHKGNSSGQTSGGG